jgi:hypothetical protein
LAARQQLNRAAAFEKLPEPGRIGGILPGAPLGYVGMLTDYIDEKERFVTCPNQDTVYGGGFQRFDSKPVIVQVPDFADVSGSTRSQMAARTRSAHWASNMERSQAFICL